MKKLFALLLLAFSNTLSAQENDQQLSATILHQDSLFWQAYNNCDADKFANFFMDDVEFYHDKGGPTLGLPALVASMKNNLCSNPDFRLRREAVPGTVKVFPLRSSGAIYGAIISGVHVFYITEKGKSEYLDGEASFTHLWLLQDGAWKMKRVLSYDHHPAAYRNKRTAISLPAATLRKYEGRYKGPQSGLAAVKAGKDLLVLHIGEHDFEIYPENEHVFFSRERDLTFEFSQDKLTVREHGAVAEELSAVR